MGITQEASLLDQRESRSFHPSNTSSLWQCIYAQLTLSSTSLLFTHLSAKILSGFSQLRSRHKITTQSNQATFPGFWTSLTKMRLQLRQLNFVATWQERIPRAKC